MGALQQLLREHGADYLERFADIPTHHKQVIGAIQRCRSDQAGHTLYHCQGCGKAHLIARSCGNRHCPGCQHQKTQAWLQCQLQRQLPGHHFMLTFTVPESLRGVLRSHQRIGYEALFQASAGAIKTLAADPKFIGGDTPGFLGVLHTWGRQLQYHPHIHYLVPGGAISQHDRQWHASSSGFYLPVRFRYRKLHSNRPRTMSLPIAEFMRRFLQHVLPSGFQKVRRFGFLSPSCAVPLEELKARIEMAHGFAEQPPPMRIEPPEPMRCPHCGGSLRFVRAMAPPKPQRTIGAAITEMSHSGP